MKLRRFGSVMFCAALVLSLRAGADDPKKSAPNQGASMADHIITPDMLKFAPVPSLPAGAEAAGLGGDMSTKGSEFTVRLRVPDGWKVPPHFHPAEEHVRVLQGAFSMGMGDKFDEGALKEMPVGAFHAIPKGVHHYGMAKGETVLQLHGVGPWGISYVNPSDDPRKKAGEKWP